MSLFDINLRFNYLTVLKSDLNREKLSESYKSYFYYFTTSQVFLNFERKIAAFLLVCYAQTKRLIGCEWVIAAVY